MKLKIIKSESFVLAGKSELQPRFYDIHSNGTVVVDVDYEQNGHIPIRVANDEIIRIEISEDWNRSLIKFFYSKNRKLFSRIVAGMYSEVCGGETIGKLKTDARNALNELLNVKFNLDNRCHIKQSDF